MDFKKVTDHVITISYLGWREFSVTDHTLTLNGAFVSLFLLRSLLTLFLLFPSFVLLLKNACTFPAHCLMWAGYSVHDLCQVKEEKYSSFYNMNSWKKKPPYLLSTFYLPLFSLCNAVINTRSFLCLIQILPLRSVPSSAEPLS